MCLFLVLCNPRAGPFAHFGCVLLLVGRSLMYMLNNAGVSALPCGRPVLRFISTNFSPLCVALNIMFSRYSVMSLVRYLSIFIFSILYFRPLIKMVLKDFSRSIVIMDITCVCRNWW